MPLFWLRISVLFYGLGLLYALSVVSRPCSWLARNIAQIIGFGMIFTSLLGGWILEGRFRKEQDWSRKMFIAQIARRFGLITPFASLLMLLTGIVNIYNLFNGRTDLWYTEGWLIAKIILFAFLLVNGALFGPILVRRRTKLIQSIVDKSAPADAPATVKILGKSVSTFYLVQFLLLVIILYLSVAGGGKHPGIF